MILSRFCSHEELQTLLRQGEIYNTIDHFNGGRGGSISIGFCLTEDQPSIAWKYLKGIVTPDTCVVYNIPDNHLQKSIGKYCSHEYDNGKYHPKPVLKVEWCTKVLKKEWIIAILPLESFVPTNDLKIARYFHSYKMKIQN